MRVMMLNERAGFFGGVEQNVYSSSIALANRGHDVSLTCLVHTGRSTDDYARPFVSVHHLQGADDTDGMRAAIRDAQPEVLVVHKWPMSGAILSARGSGNGPKPPAIRMIHDYDSVCPRKHKYYAWTGTICSRPAGLVCYADLAFLRRSESGGLGIHGLRGFFSERQRLNRYDRVIANSAFMANQLVANGVAPGSVSVLHPSVPEQSASGAHAGGAPNASDRSPAADDPPSTSGKIHGRPRPSEDALRLLFVGQIIRGKGLDLLIQAMARLPRRTVAHLNVVGTGNAQDRIKKDIERAGLGDRVTLHGWCAPDEVAQYYRESDALIVPSRWPEPFGMVGLEAMRAGLPVIAFRAGGIPDWLTHEETGLLVPPGDVGAMTAAIARVAEDADLRIRLGQRALAVAHDSFGYSRYVDQLEDTLIAVARVASEAR